MKRLSERQNRILEFIREEVDRKGYPPSVREIGDAVGLRSSSTVHGHLGRLEERGFIRRDPTKPRAIELLDRTPRPRAGLSDLMDDIVRVPIVGRVTAGEPILAVENVEDFFPIPKDMAHDDELFMLRVRGESMILAGILDGDHVLVRTQQTADNGDIVVALLGDEATVKRFYHEGTRIRLQPENPTMESIYAHDAQVIGKVVGVFRRLQ